MKHKNRALTMTLMAAIAPYLVSAADTSTDTPAATPPHSSVPALPDLLGAWGVTVSGDIAASYYHNDGYPTGLSGSGTVAPDGEGGLHGFDGNHDSFSLNEAGLQIGYQPKSGVGGFVDVIAGTDARILNEAEGYTRNGGYGSSGDVNVRQAYLQYAQGAVTVIAGKFVTAAGAETINPATDANFSRSLLFWNLEPLTHTGLRVTWAASDAISIFAGVNEGWNHTRNPGSGPRTAEFGATWAAGKVLSFAATGYFGKDDAAYDGQELSLIDLVGTYSVTSSLSLVLNADFKQTSGNGFSGTDGATRTDGYAGYVNYAINDGWRASVRGEYLDYVGLGHVSEGTFTVAYSPVKNFEIRGELRYDRAQQGADLFLRSLGTQNAAGDYVNPGYANSNLEFALQGVYHFSLPPSAH